MKKILFLLIFLPLSLCAEETVSVFYKKVILNKECIAITSLSNYEEVSEILIETDEIEDGTYKVDVTRVDSHIYKIDGTSYYIKMPYCYEYSYSDEAILKVKTFYGRKTGTLIWIED
jgi:hypothetical protein